MQACRDQVPLELKKCKDLDGTDKSEKEQALKGCYIISTVNHYNNYSNNEWAMYVQHLHIPDH